MPRLLIRSAKDPYLALTPEAALARNVIGNNSGNLLFGFAVHQMLATPDTEVVSNAFLTERTGVTPEYVARINEEFDAFVIPLANAFRPDFAGSLDRLTDVIEQLRIPVVVVGVGAQVAPSSDTLQDSVKASVSRFVRAVLDRSAALGVRGEITARCLADLGFGSEHVDVIGCPSLYLPGRDHRLERPVPELTAESPIAVNLTPTRPRMAAMIGHNFKRYPNLTYIPQETRELALMLWGEPPRGGEDRRFPLHLEHPLYQKDRVRFFVDPLPWVDFLRTQHFSFGTRIHGNIAALIAGIPAFVLPFDSRTKELSDYHAIPAAMLDDVTYQQDPAELYANADLAKFNERHPWLFDHYTAFLERNGLAHVHQPGRANPEFLAKLRAVNFPAAIAPTLARPNATDRRVLDRLRWLRQGNAADASREHGAFTPQLPLPAPQVPDPVEALETAVARLSADVDRLRKEVEASSGRAVVNAARRRLHALRDPSK